MGWPRTRPAIRRSSSSAWARPRRRSSALTASCSRLVGRPSRASRAGRDTPELPALAQVQRKCRGALRGQADGLFRRRLVSLHQAAAVAQPVAGIRGQALQGLVQGLDGLGLEGALGIGGQSGQHGQEQAGQALRRLDLDGLQALEPGRCDLRVGVGRGQIQELARLPGDGRGPIGAGKALGAQQVDHRLAHLGAAVIGQGGDHGIALRVVLTEDGAGRQALHGRLRLGQTLSQDLQQPVAGGGRRQRRGGQLRECSLAHHRVQVLQQAAQGLHHGFGFQLPVELPPQRGQCRLRLRGPSVQGHAEGLHELGISPQLGCGVGHTSGRHVGRQAHRVGIRLPQKLQQDAPGHGRAGSVHLAPDGLERGLAQ